jgi:hypothetical protein
MQPVFYQPQPGPQPQQLEPQPQQPEPGTIKGGKKRILRRSYST